MLHQKIMKGSAGFSAGIKRPRLYRRLENTGSGRFRSHFIRGNQPVAFRKIHCGCQVPDWNLLEKQHLVADIAKQIRHHRVLLFIFCFQTLHQDALAVAVQFGPVAIDTALNKCAFTSVIVHCPAKLEGCLGQNTQQYHQTEYFFEHVAKVGRRRQMQMIFINLNSDIFSKKG